MDTMDAALNKQLDLQLETYVAKFTLDNGQSTLFNKNASLVAPGGTARAVLYNDPFPIAFKAGHRPFLRSLDNENYLDFVSEYYNAMPSHSHPEITTAIHAVTDNSFMLSSMMPCKGELA